MPTHEHRGATEDKLGPIGGLWRRPMAPAALEFPVFSSPVGRKSMKFPIRLEGDGISGPASGAGAPGLHIVVGGRRHGLLWSRSIAAHNSPLNSRHHRGSNPGPLACRPSALPNEPWCLWTSPSRFRHRVLLGWDPASGTAHSPTARPRKPPVGGGGGGTSRWRTTRETHLRKKGAREPLRGRGRPPLAIPSW